MNKKISFKFRIYFTAVITLLIWMLLLWNYFNGGVLSHHILANEDLPSISNWWGGLLLPLLTWFLLFRIEKRIRPQNDGTFIYPQYLKKVVYGFIGALVYGSMLSLSFTMGSSAPSYMILAILPIGLFIPVYRSEYLLGFVIGMTYTFGAVLPTGIGSILMVIAAILYFLVRPGILYLYSKFTAKMQTN